MIENSASKGIHAVIRIEDKKSLNSGGKGFVIEKLASKGLDFA